MPPAPPPPLGTTGVRRPGLREERRLWSSGHEWVAGLDEVGRGAWAGPVSVGVAVVCPGARASSVPAWLRDSKLLAEERRDSVFGEIADWCADGAVGHASAAECDRWGMTAALRLAAYRALGALELRPDALLVDGPYDLLRAPRTPPPARSRSDPSAGRPGDVAVPCRAVAAMSAGFAAPPPAGEPVHEVPWRPAGGPVTAGVTAGPLPLPTELPPPTEPPPDAELLPGTDLPPLPDVARPGTVVPVVGGDARCAAVAAASVLAKVVRDQMMREEAVHFPAYHFERNKGYPSPAHQIALRGYGLSAIHRRSWSFVSDLPWR